FLIGAHLLIAAHFLTGAHFGRRLFFVGLFIFHTSLRKFYNRSLLRIEARDCDTWPTLQNLAKTHGNTFPVGSMASFPRQHCPQSSSRGPWFVEETRPLPLPTALTRST